jgi:hypothetical protein
MDKVFKKHPKIFMKKLLPYSNCPIGWLPLLDYLCKHLQFICDNNEIDQVVAVQVKEKFGELRFKHRGGDASTRAVVLFAEGLSRRIDPISGNFI